MKGVVLAGGRGTRLSGGEELPKPLVAIGDRPILWHVLQMLSLRGIDRFVVALGHRADEVATGFAPFIEPAWEVEMVDTGPELGSAGRLRRLRGHLPERFLLAWTDGLADVDVAALRAAHRQAGHPVTVVAVHPPPRFGQLALDGDRVVGYREKPRPRREWISGGLFVVEAEVLDRIAGDTEMWEDRLQALAATGELGAYRHEGFWQCMDTPREQERLEECCRLGRTPWMRAG